MTSVRYTTHPQAVAKDRVVEGGRITEAVRRGEWVAIEVTHPDGRVTIYSNHPNAVGMGARA